MNKTSDIKWCLNCARMTIWLIWIDLPFKSGKKDLSYCIVCLHDQNNKHIDKFFEIEEKKETEGKYKMEFVIETDKTENQIKENMKKYSKKELIDYYEKLIFMKSLLEDEKEKLDVDHVTDRKLETASQCLSRIIQKASRIAKFFEIEIANRKEEK